MRQGVFPFLRMTAIHVGGNRVFTQEFSFFFREAFPCELVNENEAQKALVANEIPIGCVIVSQGQIIGRGHNLTETLEDVTAHAEIQAITAAAQTVGGKYLPDATLYVTVEPCAMCAGAIGWAQISRIVYGAPDPKRGYATYAPRAFHPKATVTAGVLEDECRGLIQEFFKSKR